MYIHRYRYRYRYVYVCVRLFGQNMCHTFAPSFSGTIPVALTNLFRASFFRGLTST